MKDLKKKSRIFFNKSWPFIFIAFITGIFFWRVFLQNKVPIPADFVVGVYFPWLDYKWLGYGAGVPVKNPLLADIPSLIYPVRIYAMQLLREGKIPLWNSLQFGGYPLLATFQSAVFYPLNFLYLFFNNATAWTIQVMSQPLLIGIFTFLFLRHLKLSQIASVFGGIAFAFSGFNIVWLEYNIHGHVASLIPLALLFTEKYLKKRELLFGALLSLVFAMQIFAGYPQVTLYTAVLVFFWALIKLKSKIFSKYSLVSIFLVIFIVFFGAVMSAIQIVPGMELLNLSQRITEGVSGGFEVAYLPWKQIITLFAPDYFGNPATYNYWGPGNYTNGVGYSGIVTLCVASISLLALKKREVKFFIVVGVFSLILALPTPLSMFIFSSGFLGLGAATATRVLVLLNFSLAILAAFGLDELKKRKDFRAAIRAIYVPGSVIAGVFIGTYVSWRWIGKYSEFFSDLPAAFKIVDYWNSNLKVSLRNLIFPGAILFMVLLIYLVRLKYNKSINIIKLALLSILIIELFRFGWKFTPFTEKGFLYPKTPVFEFLETQEKPFRISGGDVIPISMWMPYGLESPSGYDAVYPERWAKYISVMNTENPMAAPMGRYGAVDRYNTSLFNLSNTKYILALKRDEISSPDEEGEVAYQFKSNSLTAVFEDKTVVVLENNKVLPRAFFVSEWEVLREDKILERLLDKDFPIKKRIIIEDNFADFDQTVDGKGDVKYLYHGSQRDELEVDTSVAGFLFVADAWYPGWKVLVNGVEKSILRANYTFRAVPLEEGKHKVEFIYDPKSFKMGKWVSSLSAILLVGVIIYEQTKKPKSSSRLARKRSS